MYMSLRLLAVILRLVAVIFTILYIGKIVTNIVKEKNFYSSENCHPQILKKHIIMASVTSILFFFLIIFDIILQESTISDGLCFLTLIAHIIQFYIIQNAKK